MGRTHISGSHGQSFVSLVIKHSGVGESDVSTGEDMYFTYSRTFRTESPRREGESVVFLQIINTIELPRSPKLETIWQTHSANSPPSTVGTHCEPLLRCYRISLVRAITWDRSSYLPDT